MPALTKSAVDPDLLADAHSLLRTLATERIQPADAMRRVEHLRQRSSARFDLLWDVEPFDESVRYDLIIRDEGTTTSLSVAVPGDGLPWPLRGAQRVGDRVVLDVDGEQLEISDVVSILESVPAGGDIADRLIETCLVRAALRREPADIGPEDLAQAKDGFRRAMGLHSAEKMASWLRARGMTCEDFDHHCEALAAVSWLRRQIISAAGGDTAAFADWLVAKRRTSTITWHWAIPGSSATGGRR